MFAVDITAFSSRDDSAQLQLRERMYRIVREAGSAAGLPWVQCYHEDRGDGLFLLAPSCLGAQVLVDPFLSHFLASLRRCNELAGDPARLRMRAAVHAGYVRLDTHGAAGHSLIHLFRLLDSPQLKNALHHSEAELALLASDYLYTEVIRHDRGLIDPHSFQPITISNKETRALAWLWLPTPPPPTPTPSLCATPPTSPHPPRRARKRHAGQRIITGCRSRTLPGEGHTLH
jgi:hypothetical protein